MAGGDNNSAIQATGRSFGQSGKALDRIHTVRGYAGELLNRADRITGDQEKRSIQLEADRSRAEGGHGRWHLQVSESANGLRSGAQVVLDGSKNVTVQLHGLKV